MIWKIPPKENSGMMPASFNRFSRILKECMLASFFDFGSISSTNVSQHHTWILVLRPCQHHWSIRFFPFLFAYTLKMASTSPVSFLRLMLLIIKLRSIKCFQNHSSIIIGFCFAIIYMHAFLHCSLSYRHYLKIHLICNSISCGTGNLLIVIMCNVARWCVTKLWWSGN